MKHRVLLMILMAMSCMALAAPLNNIEVRLTQPDGQVIHCYASGDEFYNYLHDANGFTIVQGEGGYYYYATRDADSKVVPSTYVVNSVDPTSVGLQPYVKISKEEYYARRYEREKYIQRPQMRKKDRELNHGLYNNLVVFIRFSGDTYHTNNFSTVEAMFNADDYEANSLHNYYHHTSYNQLDLRSHFFPQPEGETILSYEDIYPKQYYQPYDPVTNPMGYQDGETADREFSMLERAINYIEDMVPYDLDLDYNGDGLVDNVVFVIKGEPGEWASLLWPHRWCIFDRYVPLHDLQVYDFNLQLEQGGYFNVSTLCHEMFHSLGAPDLYHYNGGIDPVGPWDLMCGTSEPPQQTNSYMKYKYGNWVDEIPIINWSTDTNHHYELEPVSWEGGRRNGYMIPVSNGQYFFIEYRDKSNTFDQKIPSSGILIYLIDTRFDGNAGWNGYDILDEVYLFRPGGSINQEGTINQANFSQETGRTRFYYDSDPSPFIHDQPYQFYDPGFEITNISKTGDRMSFDILPSPNGEYSGPLIENFNAHVNSMEHQVEFSWNAIPGSDYYELFCDGNGISPEITDTTYSFPYTEDDNGYHDYSIMHVCGGLMHIYSAKTHTWAILGNYETINIDLTCDSPYGTKGGELEVTFSDPRLKNQYFTIYKDLQAHAELQVPANTEMNFIWHHGFDPESQGIRVKATHRNENGQGELFNVDNPAEGTLCTYTVSDSGLGLMAPQHLTATTVGTDVQLRWTIPTENNHFKVYRSGHGQTMEITGYECVDNSILRSGTYGFQVETSEGNTTSWHPENKAYTTVMNNYCEPPRNLHGTHSPNSNAIQWEEPEFMGYGLIAYDNNKFEERYGSASQKWGIKVDPELLAFFEGRPLAYLEMFDCAEATYTFKIYNGDKPNNASLIYTQEHEMTGSGEWVRFALDENVEYDPTQILWIVAQSTGINKPIPCCEFVNEDNSCILISGSTWMPASYFHLNYTWMLRAYTTPVEFPNNFTYNVYWGEEEASEEQIQLGFGNLTATSVVHNSNDNLRYNVTAMVDGRETDFSNTIYLGPSVGVQETQVSDNENFTYINNNNIIIENNDNITLFQIIDLTGRVVVSYHGGVRSVRTDGLIPGLYVLRIINDNEVKTQKIVL